MDDYPQVSWVTNGFNSQQTYIYTRGWQPVFERQQRKSYHHLNWFGFPFHGRAVAASRSSMSRGGRRAKRSAKMMDASPAPEMLESEAVVFADQSLDGGEVVENAAFDTNTSKEEIGNPKTDLSDVKVRTNLNETVFFMPDLHTDEDGNIIIKFTMNEALTKWKFLGLAHTKDLKFATTQKEVVTQKELMITPTPPRFFTEGDVIAYTAKVSNLSDKALTGTAQIELLDAVTMQPVTGLLGVDKQTLPFTVPAGQSAPLSWSINVPKGKVNAITHRVTCQAGNYSDGEESAIPVLTNRQLVTESKPLACLLYTSPSPRDRG